MELMDVFRIFRLRQPVIDRIESSEMASLQEINEEQDQEPIHVTIEEAISSLGESTLPTPLTGPEAIRLFNSIHTQNRTNFSIEMQESNSKPICRICRCDSTDLLIECPCRCKGSVGYVHETCLKKWKNYKRDNFCEICKFEYNRTIKRGSYLQIIKSFFQVKYFGKIIKYFINMLALTPIAYFNVTQLVDVLETFNENDIKHIIAIPTFLILTGILIAFPFILVPHLLYFINNPPLTQASEMMPASRSLTNTSDIMNRDTMLGHNHLIELDDDDDDFFASLNDDFFGF